MSSEEYQGGGFVIHQDMKNAMTRQQQMYAAPAVSQPTGNPVYNATHDAQGNVLASAQQSSIVNAPVPSASPSQQASDFWVNPSTKSFETATAQPSINPAPVPVSSEVVLQPSNYWTDLSIKPVVSNPAANELKVPVGQELVPNSLKVLPGGNVEYYTRPVNVPRVEAPSVDSGNFLDIFKGSLLDSNFVGRKSLQSNIKQGQADPTRFVIEGGVKVAGLVSFGVIPAAALGGAVVSPLIGQGFKSLQGGGLLTKEELSSAVFGGAAFSVIGAGANKALGITGSGIKAVAGRVGVNTILGASGGALYEYAETKQVTPQGIGLGAAFGAGLGLAGEVVNAGAPKLLTKIRDSNYAVKAQEKINRYYEVNALTGERGASIGLKEKAAMKLYGIKPQKPSLQILEQSTIPTAPKEAFETVTETSLVRQPLPKNLETLLDSTVSKYNIKKPEIELYKSSEPLLTASVNTKTGVIKLPSNVSAAEQETMLAHELGHMIDRKLLFSSNPADRALLNKVPVFKPPKNLPRETSGGVWLSEKSADYFGKTLKMSGKAKRIYNSEAAKALKSYEGNPLIVNELIEKPVSPRLVKTTKLIEKVTPESTRLIPKMQGNLEMAESLTVKAPSGKEVINPNTILTGKSVDPSTYYAESVKKLPMLKTGKDALSFSKRNGPVTDFEAYSFKESSKAGKTKSINPSLSFSKKGLSLTELQKQIKAGKITGAGQVADLELAKKSFVERSSSNVWADRDAREILKKQGLVQAGKGRTFTVQDRALIEDMTKGEAAQATGVDKVLSDIRSGRSRFASRNAAAERQMVNPFTAPMSNPYYKASRKDSFDVEYQYNVLPGGVSRLKPASMESGMFKLGSSAFSMVDSGISQGRIEKTFAGLTPKNALVPAQTVIPDVIRIPTPRNTPYPQPLIPQTVRSNKLPDFLGGGKYEGSGPNMFFGAGVVGKRGLVRRYPVLDPKKLLGV